MVFCERFDKHDSMKYENLKGMGLYKQNLLELLSHTISNQLMGGGEYKYFNRSLIFTIAPVPSVYDEKLNGTQRKEKDSIFMIVHLKPDQNLKPVNS